MYICPHLLRKDQERMGDNNTVSMTINGKRYVFAIGHEFGQVPTSETLCQTLRNRLDLTGTKEACSEGACGCCTVIIDGVLHHADGRVRRSGDNYDRGSSGSRHQRAGPDPAGVHRRVRLPVRLLHPRHNHDQPRPVQPQPASHPRRDSRSAERKLLPLHQPVSRPGCSGKTV